MEDAVVVDLAVGEDPGRDLASGPKRESAVAVVKIFMFEASGRWRRAARAQSALPVLASTTKRPLAPAAAAQQPGAQLLAEVARRRLPLAAFWALGSDRNEQQKCDE